MNSGKVRKIVMLCTVGTSLGSHLDGNNWKERTDMNSEKLEDFFKGIFKEPDIPDLAKNIMDKPGFSLKDGEKGLLNIVKANGIGKDALVMKNLISAEVQSILGHINRQKDPIVLDLYMYPSKDGISFLTALYGVWYLKEIYDSGLFSNWVDFLWPTIQPLNINVDGSPAFHKSINDIFSNFDKQRKVIGPDDSLVINMTGGYKSISAYASLYSLIYDIPAIYAFGDGPTVTRETFDLMPLPISCAIGAMDEEISLLKGLNDLDDVGSRKEILEDKTLPRWVSGLFVDGQPSSLVDSLIEQYEKGRNQVTGSGKELLTRLKTIDSDLGTYLERLIQTSWSELWMGDQIPETVEHSRRHSKRLMEIAGNFLRALDQGTDGVSHIYMDKAIPLALLISAIYLHDIGHTALVYPIDPDKAKDAGAFPLSMFPSAVREVHHLLSAEMIRYRTENIDESEAATRGPLFPKAYSMLGDSDNLDWKKLDSQIKILRKLLPEVCAGHRNYVRLNENVEFKEKKAVWQVGKFLMGEDRFEKTLLPLDKKLEKDYGPFFNEIDETITPAMTLTVTALLRVIDGCDVQADRVVGDDHLIQRLQRTAYEAKTLEAQLPMFEDVLKEYVVDVDGTPMSIRRCLEEICSEAGKLTPEAAKDGTMDDIDTDKIKRIGSSLYPSIFKILRGVKGEKSFNSLFEPNNVKVIQALSLANRIAFKWEQFLHFYKHRSVEVVLPVPAKKNGASSDGGVKICLLSGKNGHSKEELKSIAKDIVEEVHRARGKIDGIKNPSDYLGGITVDTDPDVSESEN